LGMMVGVHCTHRVQRPTGRCCGGQQSAIQRHTLPSGAAAPRHQRIRCGQPHRTAQQASPFICLKMLSRLRTAAWLFAASCTYCTAFTLMRTATCFTAALHHAKSGFKLHSASHGAPELLLLGIAVAVADSLHDSHGSDKLRGMPRLVGFLSSGNQCCSRSPSQVVCRAFAGVPMVCAGQRKVWPHAHNMAEVLCNS
jgi:hypothetical protein